MNDVNEDVKIIDKGGRPPADIEHYLDLLKPFLQLGYSVVKACSLANVPKSTVYDYIKADQKFSDKITLYQTLASQAARQNIVKEIVEKKDTKLSQWWLEHSKDDKEDFSQIDGSDMQQNVNVLQLIQSKDHDTSSDRETIEQQILEATEPVHDSEQTQTAGSDEVQEGTDTLPSEPNE